MVRFLGFGGFLSGHSPLDRSGGMVSSKLLRGRGGVRGGDFWCCKFTQEVEGGVDVHDGGDGEFDGVVARNDDIDKITRTYVTNLTVDLIPASIYNKTCHWVLMGD